MNKSQTYVFCEELQKIETELVIWNIYLFVVNMINIFIECKETIGIAQSVYITSVFITQDGDILVFTAKARKYIHFIYLYVNK